jgi:hypothetical protein
MFISFAFDQTDRFGSIKLTASAASGWAEPLNPEP